MRASMLEFLCLLPSSCTCYGCRSFLSLGGVGLSLTVSVTAAGYLHVAIFNPKILCLRHGFAIRQGVFFLPCHVIALLRWDSIFSGTWRLM
eukprot:6117775-Pyramimonas_sp.AAC.1